MGSSGFSGDLAVSMGGGSPAPARLHCWALWGWGAAVPTPVTDVGQSCRIEMLRQIPGDRKIR